MRSNSSEPELLMQLPESHPAEYSFIGQACRVNNTSLTEPRVQTSDCPYEQ